MKLRFLGAARTVTGSQYLVSLPDTSFLVDCGMPQAHDAPTYPALHQFDFDPAKLDYVFLTHAHIDHCGMIPRLWKLGFRGTVYATAATVDLCRVMLADSAKIQMEDAAWELRKWRKGQQATPPPAPLYTVEDAAAAMELFHPVPYDENVAVCAGLSARWVDAGHILGAASVEIWVQDQGIRRKLVFSGDVGTRGRPILRDPTLVDSADFVVMESTYGDRLHPPEEEVQAKLSSCITRAYREGGHVIVPSFAVGRTQELLYRLDLLLAEKSIPDMPVFVDSPLASSATEVFEKHRECYDEESLERLARGDNPIRFPSLRFIQSAEESMQLNLLRTPAVIIAASGMCEAGRVRHHLHHHLEHGNDVILFVGFQAQGTLGRLIVEGAKEVKLFGRKHRVRAQVCSIRGLSAHADQAGLLAWAGAITSPRAIFVTHGEPEAAMTLTQLLATELGVTAIVPSRGDQVNLLDETDIAARASATQRELAAHAQRPQALNEPQSDAAEKI